jgi:hypothetical protein
VLLSRTPDKCLPSLKLHFDFTGEVTGHDTLGFPIAVCFPKGKAPNTPFASTDVEGLETTHRLRQQEAINLSLT